MATPQLAELTARAQTLTSAGDFVGARRVLADVLDPADADPSHADADLALAAALHARILIALGDPHAARQWAGFAHAAEDRLHGARHERTMAAAATHAAVLQRVGHHGRAAQVYQTLVRHLAELDGGRSARVLAAEADLATAEHAARHCTSARHRLTQVWVQHRHQFGDADPAGIKMVARLGAMERECARDAESHEHLALAQELCARYLPADHPLVRQVAQLATAPATGRHTCGRVAQSAGPAFNDAPAARATGNGPVANGGPAPSIPFPRRPAMPDPGDDGFPPDVLPTQQPPDDRPTDPYGTAYRQPLYLADVHQTPPASEHLLPVRVPAEPHRQQPYLLVAALVAGIAVAAAAVALILPGTNREAGPAGAGVPAPPATTVPPPTPAGSVPVSDKPEPGAPTGVQLRDSRDSVALSWTYPQGSEGPVLISGGRQGQDVRVFQQLPAGSDNYVVYGLNAGMNYCFTVAVAYSADRIAASAPICTRR